MNQSRIDLLEKYMKEEPNEPFNYYALANEYLAIDAAKALKFFQQCKEKFPEYLPTYYQLAKLLEEFEREEEALAVYQLGIDLAKIQGEHKTLAELNTAHQNLLFEME